MSFIGKAQEKTSVFRSGRRRNEKTGATCPWLALYQSPFRRAGPFVWHAACFDDPTRLAGAGRLLKRMLK